MLGVVCGFGAETNVTKGLFVVRVEGLRATEGKAEIVRKKEEVSAAAKGELEEFVLEIPKSDASVELRVKQIEAMNGGSMMKLGGGTGTRGPSMGVGRALDFLLPKGRPLLSRNPHARRDPLRVLED
jgi:hypothetical protein